MAEFRWHRMEDEQPTDERGKYLILGKRGEVIAWQARRAS